MTELTIWSGWVAGAGIGVYMLVQYWYSGILLGCSAAYCNPLSIVSRLALFSSGDTGRFNNWRLWFSIGIPLGAGIAAITSPEYQWQITLSMGEKYDAILPDSLWERVSLLFVGGIALGLGARMAGGCTSGHVISGVSLLNPPSLLASALFFAGGLVTVQLMFSIFD